MRFAQLEVTPPPSCNAPLAGRPPDRSASKCYEHSSILPYLRSLPHPSHASLLVWGSLVQHHLDGKLIPGREEFVHENAGIYLPPEFEGHKESPSKALPESTLLLLPSLDIYKHGTVCVSVCLLTSNDRKDKKVKL